ncbi:MULTISPECIES: TniQ family protein [unclassified Streptomyces]|uniref:TniQ family protein n=1 Tax=unclassified Streptomyces TaxID=2593676 RepID=UPI001BE54C13|nr:MULTISPECIES: TniQ family protein [unclassified Streptomyces]MBT2408833.1 TniQ family protein [Streptomyces sp. ISL-21]MBT2612994.1 TniQ family protein [Streptomyces sp. ISL-87]
MDELPRNNRPLGRSLDPLPEESLGGYLLRLAHRLRLSPIRLARLTGIKRPAESVLGRQLLLDLDIDRFARATRLTEDETAGLTFLPWQDRYPPIARALTALDRRGTREDWLFNDFPRYCTQCLADDSGAWKTAWHLPIAFACPIHEVFLKHGCPQPHELQRTLPHLIAQAADGSLDPAQCRFPVPSDGPNPVRGKGRTGRSCGARLEWSPAGPSRPSASMLKIQRDLLDLLGPGRPAEESSSRFTDLRVVTSLLCTTWPKSWDMLDPRAREAVDEHVQSLGAGGKPAFDRPPRDAIASAGLLTAASTLLDASDLDEVLAQHTRESWDGRPSRTPWTQVFDRHRASCSERMQQAAAPSTRSYRRTSPRGTRVPDRTDGYRPENVPALLERDWFDKHLAPLEPGSYAKSMRRLGAVLLVQWAAGGAMGDAADYLGINPKGGQYTTTAGLHRWLDQGSKDFTRALHNLAHDLDAAAAPINYRRRREALHRWALTRDTWQEMTDRLPAVPGHIQPNLDDRKRQEASAFVWAQVTHGEPLFAPRPIEAEQPEGLRRSWLDQRSSTWAKLARPGRIHHFTALRGLLLQHAEQLIRKIDSV